MSAAAEQSDAVQLSRSGFPQGCRLSSGVHDVCVVVHGFITSEAELQAFCDYKNVMAAILVVEESSIGRDFLLDLLRGQGHSVRAAGDEEEARKILRTERLDLMLIDMTPGFDGRRFVERMRAEDLVAPRVLFQADARVDAEARAAASAAGDGFVMKPVNPAMLSIAVETALAAPALEGGSSDAFPSQIAKELQDHATELAKRNAELERQLTERSGQLEIARSALDQEIEKRLWAEHELTQANLHLSDQAIRDELTGLYNRRYLEVSLVREESRARRSGQSFGVVMVDIDNFKVFNDKLGHAAGDVVLRSTARYIASAARGEDILSRYGGDEFVLVMSQASGNMLVDRAETLRQGMSKLEIEYEGREVGPVTMSAGIAIYPEHGETGKAVLRVADGALYQAKQAGRNRVVMAARLPS